MLDTLAPTPNLAQFEEARFRLRDIAIATPLIRMTDAARDDVFLKLENLQPVGSFKVRCAASILTARGTRLKDGVITASAGNFAQGLAYAGRVLGIPVKAFVPETAAESKIDALRRLDAEIEILSYADWWRMLSQPNADPRFLHPVREPEGLAGNGTIALEILEQLPSVATIVAPFGAGGLSCGIAMALHAAGSHARVIAAETEAGAPLTAAFAAGQPVPVSFDSGTFITGMGGPEVLPEMWPLAKAYVAGTAVVSLDHVANAIRHLAVHQHVIAEGAGGAAVAVALSEDIPGPIVCVVSGGHLDARQLTEILEGRTP